MDNKWRQGDITKNCSSWIEWHPVSAKNRPNSLWTQVWFRTRVAPKVSFRVNSVIVFGTLLSVSTNPRNSGCLSRCHLLANVKLIKQQQLKNTWHHLTSDITDRSSWLIPPCLQWSSYTCRRRFMKTSQQHHHLCNDVPGTPASHLRWLQYLGECSGKCNEWERMISWYQSSSSSSLSSSSSSSSSTTTTTTTTTTTFTKWIILSTLLQCPLIPPSIIRAQPLLEVEVLSQAASSYDLDNCYQLIGKQ